MQPNDLVAIVALVSVLVPVVVGAAVAFPLERRRRRAHPDALPYRWGYFVGCVAVGQGLFVSLTNLALSADGSPNPGAAVAILLGLLSAIAGVNVIGRQAWAWVLLTVLSLNPVGWVIGYIYARNRWHELA